MVDDERLKQLRALGIKSVTFYSNEEIHSVEFFPTISPLNLDTLVPPAHSEVDTIAPPATEPEAPPLPGAFARILKRGSVS
jgi:hypothetical protein